VDFKNAATAEIYSGASSAKARRFLPSALHAVARRKMDQVRAASTVASLRIPPGNRLEALSGDRAGQYSIRINDQYRLCFTFEDGAAANLEIVDYH
jgi:toxin HigB-1